MIKALEAAIKKIRRLPPERQADAADALELIAKAGPAYILSAEEQDLIEEGIADADAGRIVPAEEMETFWSRHTRHKCDGGIHAYGFRCAPPAATLHGPSGAEVSVMLRLIVCGR